MALRLYDMVDPGLLHCLHLVCLLSFHLGVSWAVFVLRHHHPRTLEAAPSRPPGMTT